MTTSERYTVTLLALLGSGIVTRDILYAIGLFSIIMAFVITLDRGGRYP